MPREQGKYTVMYIMKARRAWTTLLVWGKNVENIFHLILLLSPTDRPTITQEPLKDSYKLLSLESLTDAFQQFPSQHHKALLG